MTQEGELVAANLDRHAYEGKAHKRYAGRDAFLWKHSVLTSPYSRPCARREGAREQGMNQRTFGDPRIHLDPHVYGKPPA